MERRWRQVRKDTGYEWGTPHTSRKTVRTLTSEATSSEFLETLAEKDEPTLAQAANVFWVVRVDDHEDPCVVSGAAGTGANSFLSGNILSGARSPIGLDGTWVSQPTHVRYIAERTVEAHITQTFQKLGLVEVVDAHLRVLATLLY